MNRKRVLWPLLLAAAFALGVLAAQVQAASIFLPLVAKASTGQETPTPTPQDMVRVQNVHYYASKQRFYGELVNETTCTVSAARVTLYLLDEDGLPVTNKTGYPMASILSPGERTPFQVYWYDTLPAWDSYVVVVHWDPTHLLTVESAVFTKGDYGGWKVTARVRNQLPVRVQTLAVGTVLYGPSGQLVGYNDPSGHLGPLDPGDTLTLTHLFDHWNWDTSIEPVGCAAFAVPSGGFALSVMEEGYEQTDSE